MSGGEREEHFGAFELVLRARQCGVGILHALLRRLRLLGKGGHGGT